MNEPCKPLLYLVAGEASGDFLGARLMVTLRDEIPNVQFAGVGGAKMEAQGLNSLFPITDLSVMGVTEVVPQIFNIIRRLNQTTKNIKFLQPAALITIDSPDFCFRLAAKLQNSNFPLLHYVAPTVWAWRPSRAAKISSLYDHILCLLPFEPPYFKREGLNASFVGHPILESSAKNGNGKKFRKLYGIKPKDIVLCFLPGSRDTEITKLIPIFLKVLMRLKQEGRKFRVVVPTHQGIIEKVKMKIKNWPGKPILVQTESEKYDAFSASNVALAASGTVSLELALANVPTVIAYKLSPITAWFVKKAIKVKYINLINLILDKNAVPELLQENCCPKLLAENVTRLLDYPEIAKSQSYDFKSALELLTNAEKDLPSVQAAKVISQILRK